MSNFILEISYLLGSISFILGLKMLSHPETARKGNLLAAAGMAIAILATIFFHENEAGEPIGNLIWIFAAIGVGTFAGYLMAMKVKMTAMPQMVSLFNGMGGACAAIISIVEYTSHPSHDVGFLAIAFLGLMIGSVSFSGSMVAYGKLDGKINDWRSNAVRMFNNVLLAGILALIGVGVFSPDMIGEPIVWILLVVSLIYGILFVMPIGGADMPVVISLLN
jgi:NAD(P) transhydrogenase subunit beta